MSKFPKKSAEVAGTESERHKLQTDLLLVAAGRHGNESVRKSLGSGKMREFLSQVAQLMPGSTTQKMKSGAAARVFISEFLSAVNKLADTTDWIDSPTRVQTDQAIAATNQSLKKLRQAKVFSDKNVLSLSVASALSLDGRTLDECFSTAEKNLTLALHTFESFRESTYPGRSEKFSLLTQALRSMTAFFQKYIGETDARIAPLTDRIFEKPNRQGIYKPTPLNMTANATAALGQPLPEYTIRKRIGSGRVYSWKPNPAHLFRADRRKHSRNQPVNHLKR